MHFVIEKASLSEVGLWFKRALKLIGSFPEYVATLHLKTSEILFFFFFPKSKALPFKPSDTF